MSKMTTFLAGAGFGAAFTYFLDPRSGGERRHVARDKAGQVAQSGPVQTVAHTAANQAQTVAQTAAQQAQTVAQTAAQQAQGVVGKAKQAATGGDSAPGDDNTLKAKVETEIFRDADAPKGSVVVTVVNGIVELRGETDAQWSERLESEAGKVSGVQAVRNLTHRPGETPPNLAGTPGVSGS
jgi:osmotically-inducible protein OsmY